jgi:putative endonuclease
VPNVLGQRGEQLAADHYLRLGYDVVARGFRTRFGEIDLIVSDGQTLVFAEVKTRRAGSGRPFDSLHEAKQHQVRRMAAAYLAQVDRPFAENLRFDAIGVVIDPVGELVSLDHLEGAF